jgi:hypothetical protein
LPVRGTATQLSRWLWTNHEVVVMRYRVYSGPPGTDEVSLVQDRTLFKELGSLDEALSWARHLEKGGRVPLLIEGDDGTRMNKREIGEALRLGGREEVAADNFGIGAGRR